MDGFLASVERYAFRMARVATGNSDEALDIVQDTMMKLVQRYSDRGEHEWAGLFHRILQNRIRDWHRRAAVRNRIGLWFGQGNDADEQDPVSQIPDTRTASIDRQLADRQFSAQLETELHKLPYRQQQAFILRVWQDMDVNETANAMGCSAGSVKTHFSRAVHSLRKTFEGYE